MEIIQLLCLRILYVFTRVKFNQSGIKFNNFIVQVYNGKLKPITLGKVFL